MALVMSMGTAAFAASITITADETYASAAGDPYSYSAYKIFDASYTSLTGTNTQNDKDPTYTPNDANVAYFMATGNPWISTIQGLTDYFTVTEVVGGYSVVAKDTFTTAAQAKTLAAALKTALDAMDPAPSGDYAAKAVTTNGGAVTVDAGYYLIVSDTAANLALVTTDVTLVEKNDYTKLIKEFTDETTVGDFDAGDDETTSNNDTVQVGDTVSYTLTVVIPSGANQAMVVKDTFTSGLSPVMDGSVVKTTITGMETGTTATVSGITAATETANAFFTVSLDADTVIANAGKTITIVYEAVVTEDAWSQTEVNTGEVKYGNDYNTTPDSVDSVTYNLTIQKKADSESGDSLKGAQFKLYRTDNKGHSLDKAAVTLVALTDEDLTAASITKAADTVYYRVADADDTTTTDTIDMTEAYDAVIYGLDGDSTYYVEETKAPTGYNKLEGYTEVQMNKANQVQPIVNNSGTVLPSTGGIGTTIFYVVGSILVVAAGVLLITKKRMSREG